VTGQNSRLPNAAIVAIVSDDVTIEKISISSMRIRDRGVLLEISGAFDQIQVFVQMLGGLLLKGV
jgi:hypothetical protein